MVSKMFCVRVSLRDRSHCARQPFALNSNQALRRETIMTIIEALLGEHAALHPLFDRIEVLAQNADLPELKIHADLLESTLISQADLEDSLLGPQIQPYLPSATGPTDHDEIRAGLKRVGAAACADDARRYLFETLARTRRHFRKEESTAFVFARRKSSSALQEQLAVEWARIRGVSVGETGCD